jgi:CHRD domain
MNCLRVPSKIDCRRASRLVRIAALCAIAVLMVRTQLVSAQSPSPPMSMSTKTLLLAQLDGKQVVGNSSSSATGTGAFVLDSVARSLTYNLTYQGLEAGPPDRIALYNFGVGKNGTLVTVLCGPEVRRCPASPSGTIVGDFERDERLDNHLVGEFDSGRVYVEITGGNNKPEIRGQLGLNSAMVSVANYVAQLGPLAGTASRGSGTAVVSETHLPGGKVLVFYALTVARTSGAPINAVLVPNSSGKMTSLNLQEVMPQVERRYSREKSTGGTLTGSYNVNVSAPQALLASRFFAIGNREASIVVVTSRFQKGELSGELRPVR